MRAGTILTLEKVGVIEPRARLELREWSRQRFLGNWQALALSGIPHKPKALDPSTPLPVEEPKPYIIDCDNGSESRKREFLETIATHSTELFQPCEPPEDFSSPVLFVNPFLDRDSVYRMPEVQEPDVFVPEVGDDEFITEEEYEVRVKRMEALYKYSFSMQTDDRRKKVKAWEGVDPLDVVKEGQIVKRYRVGDNWSPLRKIYAVILGKNWDGSMDYTFAYREDIEREYLEI
ncbi:hypothetical protein VNI00_016560 [Paramarasmius palmivorus]|uniref:Uncharacterized protein n=1 Tax=Paramarasmius palmivorus TaxID=297713 RepID=A0AAW0BBV2_9AGAR